MRTNDIIWYTLGFLISYALEFGGYKPYSCFNQILSPTVSSKHSSCIRRRSNKTRMVERRGSQQKAILPRLLARLTEGVEVPQLTNGHAEQGEEILVEDYSPGTCQYKLQLEKN